MISGNDHVIKTPGRWRILDVVIHCCLRQWPETIVVDESATDNLVSFVRTREFFFYRDGASKRSWEDDGRTDENASAMIHLLISEHQTTLVWEVAGSAAQKIVCDVTTMIGLLS